MACYGSPPVSRCPLSVWDRPVPWGLASRTPENAFLCCPAEENAEDAYSRIFQPPCYRPALRTRRPLRRLQRSSASGPDRSVSEFVSRLRPAHRRAGRAGRNSRQKGSFSYPRVPTDLDSPAGDTAAIALTVKRREALTSRADNVFPTGLRLCQ